MTLLTVVHSLYFFRSSTLLTPLPLLSFHLLPSLDVPALILRSTSSMCVDLAFLIESQVDDELPERVLGVTRFGQCDISALGIEIGLPESYDDDAEQGIP